MEHQDSERDLERGFLMQVCVGECGSMDRSTSWEQVGLSSYLQGSGHWIWILNMETQISTFVRSVDCSHGVTNPTSYVLQTSSSLWTSFSADRHILHRPKDMKEVDHPANNMALRWVWRGVGKCLEV